MNLDVFQMQQCEMQAALFESLDRRPIDAKVFIRAFMNSKAAAGLDSTFDHFQWAGIKALEEPSLVLALLHLKHVKVHPSASPCPSR